MNEIKVGDPDWLPLFCDDCGRDLETFVWRETQGRPGYTESVPVHPNGCPA